MGTKVEEEAGSNRGYKEPESVNVKVIIAKWIIADWNKGGS